MSESTPTSSSSRAPFRWKIGLGILLAGLLAEGILWLVVQDITWRAYYTLHIIPITVMVLSVWWLFLSGLRVKRKLQGVGTGVSLVLLFVICFRFEGMTGSGWPYFSWRFGESAEEQRENYHRENLKELITAGSESGTEADEEDTFPPLPITAADWPGFRGSNRDGIVRNHKIRTDWESNPPKELWRHPIGKGWSSCAIVAGRVFTQEQHNDQELVTCYDAHTGEPLWVHADDDGYKSAASGDGPRCTPTVWDSKVYSLGATGTLNCLSVHTGQPLWTTNILDDADADNRQWGTSGSPLVTDGLVIVNPGGSSGKLVIAYDALSGEIQWTAGDAIAGYMAPRVETLDGVRQVLVFDGKGLAGYKLKTGSELWRLSWKTDFDINVAQPIVRDGNRMFVSSGYSTGSGLYEVKRDAEGKWPERPKELWRAKNTFKLKFNDGVRYKDTIYGIDDGILACIDYNTGELGWKKGRYSFGQLLLLPEQELILVQAQSGKVALVKADPDRFQQLTWFRALNGQTWNHPVLWEGKLYVRNSEEIACYDVSSP